MHIKFYIKNIMSDKFINNNICHFINYFNNDESNLI